MALGSVPPTTGATYRFEGGQNVNITFQSETALETVFGTTSELLGIVEADLEAGTARVDLSVPVASLRTGIELRDEHLRSAAWLDAARYPEIRFASDQARRDKNRRWSIQGQFTLHGITRNLDVTAEVRQVPAAAAAKAGLADGEWIRITVPFQVRLADFGIRIPESAMGKVSEIWDVRIQAFAWTAEP
jgi:polyisoprenoid-binding protein YceI